MIDKIIIFALFGVFIVLSFNLFSGIKLLFTIELLKKKGIIKDTYNKNIKKMVDNLPFSLTIDLIGCLTVFFFLFEKIGNSFLTPEQIDSLRVPLVFSLGICFIWIASYIFFAFFNFKNLSNSNCIGF